MNAFFLSLFIPTSSPPTKQNKTKHPWYMENEITFPSGEKKDLALRLKTTFLKEKNHIYVSYVIKSHNMKQLPLRMVISTGKGQWSDGPSAPPWHSSHPSTHREASTLRSCTSFGELWLSWFLPVPWQEDSQHVLQRLFLSRSPQREKEKKRGKKEQFSTAPLISPPWH